MSMPSGSTAPPGTPMVTASSIRSTRNVRTASRSRSHATRYQCPKRNQSPAGVTRRTAVAVGEGSRRVCSNGLEEVDQCPRRRQRGDGTHLAHAGGSQLQKSIPTTRIGQVNAGNGQMKGNLLIWFECQIRQVERVPLDQVPVLLLTGQPLRAHRDPLVPQEPLVPFERLASRRVLLGDTRAPAGRSNRGSGGVRC